MPFVGCKAYREEITTEWCADHADNDDYMGICDGSKRDCVARGKEKCTLDPDCFGIMYHGGSWGPHYKGVKVCKSTILETKGDWDVYIKCENQSTKYTPKRFILA